MNICLLSEYNAMFVYFSKVCIQEACESPENALFSSDEVFDETPEATSFIEIEDLVETYIFEKAEVKVMSDDNLNKIWL